MDDLLLEDTRQSLSLNLRAHFGILDHIYTSIFGDYVALL